MTRRWLAIITCTLQLATSKQLWKRARFSGTAVLAHRESFAPGFFIIFHARFSLSSSLSRSRCLAPAMCNSAVPNALVRGGGLGRAGFTGWWSGWAESKVGGWTAWGGQGVGEDGQEVEVAPLFVCQPRWDPLPILLSTPRSPFPLNYPLPPPHTLRTPCGCGIDARDRARTHTRAHVCTYARQRERVRSVYTGVVVYVLHLTNITSMYSANAMCRGYIANA